MKEQTEKRKNRFHEVNLIHFIAFNLPRADLSQVSNGSPPPPPCSLPFSSPAHPPVNSPTDNIVSLVCWSVSIKCWYFIGNLWRNSSQGSVIRTLRNKGFFYLLNNTLLVLAHVLSKESLVPRKGSPTKLSQCQFRQSPSKSSSHVVQEETPPPIEPNGDSQWTEFGRNNLPEFAQWEINWTWITFT